MSQLRVKRGITKKFKRFGLSLKKDALNKLLELHAQCANDDEFDQLLEQLGELTLSQKLSSPVLSLNDIKPALEQMNNNDPEHNEHEENLLSLENAFDAKRFRYKQVGKQFLPVANGSLHGDASDLSAVFVDRYETLLQRVLRHSIFRRSTLQKKRVVNHMHERDSDEDIDLDQENEDDSGYEYHLTNTSELIGTKSRKCVFGMLCELEEGLIHLQDVHGSVQIDVSQISDMANGMFTFNCFVLCEGVMNGARNVFAVDKIGFPPYEPRQRSLKTFDNLHFVPFEKRQIMLDLEQKAEQDEFVFMSNVYLDESVTFDQLNAVFDGFAATEVAPALFVLMGNFTKRKLGASAKDMKFLASLFDKLCDLLINKYASTLCKSSDFIFIPGPNDQLIGNLLPQPKLIPSLCQKFLYHAENQQIHVHFQSNPFRIRFGTQEIVCFRYDLLQKMRRNCVLTPNLEESKELTNHLVKTILDQAHLCPLPLQICPIYWNYSHALSLYPAPHLVVVGDSNDSYNWKYQDCRVVCPGNFSETKSFILYRPHDKYVDFCKAP